MRGSPAQYHAFAVWFLRSWRETKPHALALLLKPPTHAVRPCDRSYESGLFHPNKTQGRDDSGRGMACRMGFHRTRCHQTERCAVLRLAGWAWPALAPTRMQTLRARASVFRSSASVLVSWFQVPCCTAVPRFRPSRLQRIRTVEVYGCEGRPFR